MQFLCHTNVMIYHFKNMLLLFTTFHYPSSNKCPKMDNFFGKNTKSYGKALFRVFLEYKPLCSQKWKS